MYGFCFIFPDLLGNDSSIRWYNCYIDRLINKVEIYIWSQLYMWNWGKIGSLCEVCTVLKLYINALNLRYMWPVIIVLLKITKNAVIDHLDEWFLYRKCVAGFSLIWECFHMILLLFYELNMHSWRVYAFWYTVIRLLTAWIRIRCSGVSVSTQEAVYKG